MDSYVEKSGERNVLKFRLELSEVDDATENQPIFLQHTRMIPSSIKREVWGRVNGQCVKCGSEENLHFDHIIPYSKGRSSLVAENIQKLCAKHNLEKSDHIE